MASDGVGEGLGYLYSAGHWEFKHAPVSIWIKQTGLGVWFSSFCMESIRVGGWTWKEWKASMIRVHWMKFPNNQ